MPQGSAAEVIATIVFWALMLPIVGYIFQTVCNLCGADAPTFRRSILDTVLVSAAAFFLFDGIGYGIVQASRDTIQVNLPPGYDYLHWLREPLYLKWQVLGLIPILRYLLLLFAACLAAMLYVFILTEPFRNCIAILAIQWTFNVAAMAVLSFVLTVTLRFVTPPPSAPKGTPTVDFSGVAPKARAATRPQSRFEHAAAPSTNPGLHSALADRRDDSGSSLSQTRQQLHAFHARLAPYLEPIETACAPYTRHFPPVVQEFLDDGGWWLVLLAVAAAAAFWLRTLARRLKRAVFPRTRHHHRRHSAHESSAVIDLDLVADAFTDPGPQQITVRGQPGRLRLIVLAPSPNYTGELLPEMADSLLDWLQPGMGEILDADTPRCVVWPRHAGLGQFVGMFHKLVQVPEVRGRRSPWVLLSGSAHLGRQTVFLGLAVFLDKTTYQREICVDKEKWSDVLGLQQVTETV